MPRSTNFTYFFFLYYQDGRDFKKRRLDTGPSAFSPPNYAPYFVSVPLNDAHQVQQENNFHPHYSLPMSIPVYPTNNDMPHYSHDDGPLPSIPHHNYPDSFTNGHKMPYLPQFIGYQNHPPPHDHLRDSQHNGYMPNNSPMRQTPTADLASSSVKEAKPANNIQPHSTNPTKFVLVDQPQEKQRKAYQNENRY